MKLLVVYLMFVCTCISLHAELKFVKDEINDTIEDIASFYNFTYKFSNIGSTPIKIVDIKTSCTCTIPSIKKNTFMPNEGGEITGYIDVNDKVGLQENIITVYTDSISQPQKKLFLKINITRPVEIKPHVLFWPKCSSPVGKKILITTINSWRLHDVECNKKLFDIKIKGECNESEISVTPVSTLRSSSDTVKISFINKDGDKRKYIIHIIVR